MTPGPSPDLRRVLLLGGGGGLVGRAVLEEFAPDHRIRSFHRRAVPREAQLGVEWVPGDLGTQEDWTEVLEGVDLILNLVWHRTGSRRRFEPLAGGLSKLLEAAKRSGVRRFVHLSVPRAPDHLEREFPYLTYRRRFDAELAASGLSYRIVRPTMLFGPGDVLIDVMRREMRRYPFFPMFGDGRYHVSPLATRDLARILRREASNDLRGTIDVGGPHRYEYRELCDLLFRSLGKAPRYWRLTERGGVRLARLLETFGSHLLYAYEVEWLVSDLLGLAPDPGLRSSMMTLESYLGVPAAASGSSP